MKNSILLLFFLLFTASIFAQNMAVKSFEKVANDMTARIDAKKIDQNGDVCAIIKVETTQTGFSWESDALGIVAAIPKVGEYWLYIPYGAKRLTIKHPILGILRDYSYPLPIEKATVYVLTLVAGKVITTVEETIESQWLVIATEPADAAVYIDEVFVKAGTYQTKLKAGSYTYRIEAPLYHTEAGKLEITDSKKELNIKLKPAFGYITVSTLPENDAKVIIDGKPLIQTSPCKTEALASGEHTVQVMKEMYQPTTQKVKVVDGQTTPITFTLQPNFAEVTITALKDATLYVNNEKKATGNWSGRLNAGVYSLEARLDKYRTAKQDIELTAGDKRTIDLQPTPIYGSLDVISTPVGASISINGKEYGTTPNTINKLLIGEYTVQLSKTGYANVAKTINIAEGKSGEINETLIYGRAVTINSTPSGATLFIDGNKIGNTPYSGSLAFGSHSLRIEKDGKKAEKSISISQNGGENHFTLSFGPQTITETVNGVRFDMVAVKGGTFRMGSESGESNEKPVRSVTLSDFTIGKTEVTQALWQAVMGDNPSYWKGVNLPVEQVSWDDIQIFLQKLNQLTGKTYRLPTEAEWEYAAKGGTSSRSTTYAGSNSIDNVAWYDKNSGNKTHIVAGKQPNELGLYDMSGNVWEWCSDWYGSYSSTAQTNPKGASTGSYRMIRGGSWNRSTQDCRSAFRNSIGPYYYYNFIGFRVVFVP